MADLINLRRARKLKAREAAAKTAEANRTLHGTSRHARDLAKAQSDKGKRDLDARRLQPKDENTD
jgi:Domain of unknown function (DUF4169)